MTATVTQNGIGRCDGTGCGNTEQLGSHLGRAIQNGVTREELIEAITHVTLYAGWPRGMSAMGVAKQVFADDK